MSYKPCIATPGTQARSSQEYWLCLPLQVWAVPPEPLVVSETQPVLVPSKTRYPYCTVYAYLPSAINLMRLWATSRLTKDPPCSNTAFIVAMNHTLSGANVILWVKEQQQQDNAARGHTSSTGTEKEVSTRQSKVLTKSIYTCTCQPYVFKEGIYYLLRGINFTNTRA